MYVICSWKYYMFFVCLCVCCCCCCAFLVVAVVASVVLCFCLFDKRWTIIAHYAWGLVGLCFSLRSLTSQRCMEFQTAVLNVITPYDSVSSGFLCPNVSHVLSMLSKGNAVSRNTEHNQVSITAWRLLTQVFQKYMQWKQNKKCMFKKVVFKRRQRCVDARLLPTGRLAHALKKVADVAV